MSKLATDLEQSEKLSKILKIDSADMVWNVCVDDTKRLLPKNDWDATTDGNRRNIPAWSVDALLKALKDYNLLNIMDGRCLVSSNSITSHLWIDPVDACVEMIEELKERNLL